MLCSLKLYLCQSLDQKQGTAAQKDISPVKKGLTWL